MFWISECEFIKRQGWYNTYSTVKLDTCSLSDEHNFQLSLKVGWHACNIWAFLTIGNTNEYLWEDEGKNNIFH